jgi:hypothetical protein
MDSSVLSFAWSCSPVCEGAIRCVLQPKDEIHVLTSRQVSEKRRGCPTRRCSEREPADSLRDKSNVIGGWLLSLTCVRCDRAMSAPATSQPSSNLRRSRAHIWAAIAGTIHVSVFLSPFRIASLSSGASLLFPYLVVSVPAAWALYMLFRYRTRGERAVAWISLGLSVLWFMSVGFVRT